MAAWLALFRGINVGGKHLVIMKTLLEKMQEAGCQQTQSYIQSGNVVFTHAETDKNTLSELLSDIVASHFGFRPKVLVLSAADFNHVVANNPFQVADEQGKNLYVFFLETPAHSADLALLDTFKAASEQYHLQDEAFYLYAPEGVGRSTLVSKVDKCLGVVSTARNLNTLKRISAILSQLS